MRISLILLLATLLLGCETRTHKNLRLEHEALQIEHTRVLEQMNGIWQQSLKTRFPLIEPVAPSQKVTLDPKHMRYIRAIELAPDPHVNNQWQVTVTHQTEKSKVHPNYVIYLFDRRGLNIGKLRVDPKKWAGMRKAMLKPGAASITTMEIPLDFPERPRYFWIRFLG